jgi:vancomycin resistance protein YoaR
MGIICQHRLSGKQLDKAMLRDDAAEMLTTIARDMETPQTAAQQPVKSKATGQRQHKIPPRKRIAMFELARL